MDTFDFSKEALLENFLKENFGQEIFKGELARTYRFFKPYKKKFKKIITIAGTNGKGETSTHFANLVNSTGIKVALWTSPHILSIRERFIFSGQMIGYDELLKEFRKTFRKIKWLWGKFSYYEFLFYVFIRLARKKKMNILVLEVGLGGRLDAVNHFDADISLLTSISRDHQAILGNTLEKILHEKLGITRPGKQLISSLELEYCRFLTNKFCKEKSIPHLDLQELGVLDHSLDFSERNKLMAAFAFELFKNQRAPKNLDLSQYKFLDLKGRFETIKKGSITFIFVGSHNIDGVRKLVNKVGRGNQEYDAALISLSKRPEKEIEKIIEIFSNAFKKVILTSFDHVKAAEELKLFADKLYIEFEADWKTLLENKIKNQNVNETLLVTGSYYFVGEVQKFLLSPHFDQSKELCPNEISDLTRECPASF